jgi:hypothetical protein
VVLLLPAGCRSAAPPGCPSLFRPNSPITRFKPPFLIWEPCSILHLWRTSARPSAPGRGESRLYQLNVASVISQTQLFPSTGTTSCLPVLNSRDSSDRRNWSAKIRLHRTDSAISRSLGDLSELRRDLARRREGRAVCRCRRRHQVACCSPFAIRRGVAKFQAPRDFCALSHPIACPGCPSLAESYLDFSDSVHLCIFQL